MRNSQPVNPYISLYLAAFLLAALGWGGLYMLVVRFIPTPGPIWLFFVLLLAAITGTTVPFMRFLDRRFAQSPAMAAILLRRATWVGIFGTTIAWLRIGRALNIATGLLLAFALLAIEWFIELRERSRWQPEPQDDEE